MNNYYVYFHRRLTDNKIFYVGKGKDSRHKSSRGRNVYWKRIVAKHGFISEIIDNGLNEEQAFELEKFCISFFSDKLELCNMTTGGEGCSSLVGSESRKKQAEANKRRVWTEEAKNKISVANKGRKKSKEVIEKLSKLKGALSSRSDKNVYSFVRILDGLIVTCTRYELCEKYKIKPEELKCLFGKRARLTSKGWRLIND